MKRIFPIVMAFMLAFAMPTLAFAAGGNGGGGGNGSGGGNGGGSGEPLTVVSASIENGAQIEADGTITLVFSKNVCEAGVRDTNMTLVAVKDAQGNDVAAVVTLADDQIEPNKKNDMVIGFAEPLAGGTYTLTAQAGITSKSGDVLAEDYVLEFTVAAAEPAASASASAASASASASAASASASAASASASSASASSAAASGTASGQQNGGDATPFIIGGVVIVAAVIGGIAYSKRKK